MYPTSVFSITCGTRAATKGPQRKPMEQLLDMDWTFPGDRSRHFERRTRGATGVDPARQAGAKRLCGELQRATAGRMPERELVHEFERCAAQNRKLAASFPFVPILPARLCYCRTSRFLVNAEEQCTLRISATHPDNHWLTWEKCCRIFSGRTAEQE